MFQQVMVNDPQGTNFGKMASGVPGNTGRIDEVGGLVTTNLHGRFRESARRGHIWAVHEDQARAVSVALNTTYTGLYLYNPPGSGCVVSLIAVGFAISVAPATIASIHLGGGYLATGGITTETSALTPFSSQLGNTGAAAAHAGYAATLATSSPKYIMPLNHANTNNALPVSNTPAMTFIDGAYEAWPGGYFIIVALTAITGFGGFVWEEVPL